MATLTINNVYCGAVCFGYLYNYYTFTDSRELTSSDDWIIPTQVDWNTLNSYVTLDYNSLKASGNVFWSTNNGTNTTGLGLRGGGFRSTTFSSIKTSGDYANINNARASYRDNGIFMFVSVSTALHTGVSVRLLYTGAGSPTSYVGNDGKTYGVVKIGTQYWTTENLEETQYRNGDSIPEVTDNTTWANLTTGALCLYDNDANNACKTPLPTALADINYGYLYNYYALVNTKKISSSDDWGQISWDQLNSIIGYLGGTGIAGGPLKETGTDHWNLPNTDATNAYNLFFKGTGRRDELGNFTDIKNYLYVRSLNVIGSQTYCKQAEYNTASFPTNYRYFNEGLPCILARTATGIADNTMGTYTGNDGKIYLTSVINEIEIVASPLAETLYRDKTEIANIEDSASWISDTNGARCAYNNDESNAIN